MKLLIILALALGLPAQDSVTITVKRGTQTRTAEISGAVVADVFKALDYHVATGGGSGGANETDALRKIIVGQLVALLHSLPGHPIQQTSAAYRAAVDAFTSGAEAAPVK